MIIGISNARPVFCLPPMGIVPESTFGFPSSMYAEPRNVSDLSKCRFYHAMDLPDGQFVRGNWDLRNSFEKYTGFAQFAGRRMLDVGTASGFLTFEAEKRGAEVVSFDSSSPKMHAGV